MAEAKTQGAAKRQTSRVLRPTQPQPNSSFDGRVVRFKSRRRICWRDLVEIVGEVLPDNLGKVCIVTGFGTDAWNQGWAEVESLTGLLSSRDVSTGEVKRSNCLTLFIDTANLYRLDNSLKSRYLRGSRHG